MGGFINRPNRGWESRVKMKTNRSEFIKKHKTVNNVIRIRNVCHKQFVPNKDKLVCFYVNARSIVYKMSELELYIFEDIIGITESWTFEDLQNSELNIDGYVLLRKDRILGEKVRGGGVILYIRSTLDATVREDLGSVYFPECIWCDVKIQNKITLIGICYTVDVLQVIN